MSEIQTSGNAPELKDWMSRVQGAIAYTLKESGRFVQEVYQDLPETNDISQIQDVFFPCCFLELTEIENSRASKLGLFRTMLDLNILIILGEYQRTDFTQRNEAKTEARNILSWMTNWLWTLDDTRSDLPNLLQFAKDERGRFIDPEDADRTPIEDPEMYVPKNLLYIDSPTPGTRFCLEYYNTFETLIGSEGSIRIYLGEEEENEP